MSGDYWLIRSILNQSLESGLFALFSLQVLRERSEECLNNTSSHYRSLPDSEKDPWRGVLDCNTDSTFTQPMWNTDCTLGIWLGAPEGKTALFPLFREMKGRLMAHEMKKMQVVKKVRKRKVKRMACWSWIQVCLCVAGEHLKGQKQKR